MGTLTEQPPRDLLKIYSSDVEHRLREIRRIADQYQFTNDFVLEVWKLLEQERRNDLFVADRDIFDEQQGGWGQLAESFIEHYGTRR